MKRLVLIIVTLLMFQCGWAEDMVGAWLLPSKNIGGINYLLYEEKGGVVVDNYNSWDGSQIIDAEIKAQPGSNVMLLNNGQITPMTN